MVGDGRRLVYSTGPDGPVSGDGKPTDQEMTSRSPGEQRIVVRIARSGRAGKTVTVAGPFALARDDAAKLISVLRKQLGTGGTLRDGADGLELEIRGDRVQALVDELNQRGFKARRG